jgi:two-component system response regulator AtoC
MESPALMGEISSAVAHSLRNPLASIRSSAELVLATDHEPVRKNAQDIISQVDFLSRWVRELPFLTQPPAMEAESVDFCGQGQHQRPGRIPSPGLAGLIGDSPAMAELKSTIRQVLEAERRMAGGPLPAVLISGETGTGKELVARSLHYDGCRRDRPFVEVNCAAIPSHLLEAELFGHEKGAFTDAKERKLGLVESADGGTLFLDEIGEVDPGIQVKLLKLLEEKTIRRIGSVKERRVDLRIISATNRDLEQMVREGKFRSDLFFRLRIISIRVPPLRARGGDILLLARHFLDSHGRRYGKPGLRFSPEAERMLANYTWPGNVRELRNMLEQSVLLAPGGAVTPDHFTFCPGLAPGQAGEERAGSPDIRGVALPGPGVSLAEVEREMVARALDRSGWNVTRAARLLGISRDMMRYRIEKMGLVRPEA